MANGHRLNAADSSPPAGSMLFPTVRLARSCWHCLTAVRKARQSCSRLYPIVCGQKRLLPHWTLSLLERLRSGRTAILEVLSTTTGRKWPRHSFLIRPYSNPLHPILRELVIRFGPRSSIASGISARLHSTDGAVSSLADHDAGTLKLVRHWADDENPAVSTFARQICASLEASFEKHAAYEEHERRRFGT